MPEDRLEGATNFVSWKFRTMLALKEHELNTLVEKALPMPDEEDEKLLWTRNNNKAMKLLVDGVKDHIVPIISKLDTTYLMFSTLENMFEINNTSRVFALKQQLHHIKMNQSETITSYFMRITELRNQLSTIGHTFDSKELTMLALNGLPTSWESFIQGISARSKLPKFDRLKTDCIQEESKLTTRGAGINSQNEEMQALNSQSHKRGKRNNFKKRRGKDSTKKQSFKLKRDLCKVQCFRCDKYGHIAIKCPDRPKPQASIVEVSEPNTDSKRLVFYSALSTQVSTSLNT